MVFQSYALYPQMSVEGNLSFGLKNARVPKDEIARRVARAAEILQIEPLLERKPSALSGGQRQRVAIGRALGARRGRVPVRRAAVEPRRQAARRASGGAEALHQRSATR
jgi:ABC-type sugar transport system ATPase subunit